MANGIEALPSTVQPLPGRMSSYGWFGGWFAGGGGGGG
jgi:hypothetical protein